jgi:ABC-2 type transport system permease protein
MIRKIGLVAKREIVTTVSSKGFIIGILLMPAMFALFIVLAPRILGAASPVVHGDVAIIDPTGVITPMLREALDPDAIKTRMETAAKNRMGPQNVPAPPDLKLIERPAGTDVQQEKAWLSTPTKDAERRHIALIVIHPDAVQRAAGKEDFGVYDLYLSRGVANNTETAIHDSLRRALLEARMKAAGMDFGMIEATLRLRRPDAVFVGAGGEQAAKRGLNQILPFVCGFLLFIGVMMGGQALMTSTVEEKSNRVIEVLLAAVSPLELMWGKLIGQLAVGLIVMGVYIGLGLLGLTQFALFGLLDPMLIVYLFIFYLTSYLVFGALMMAIGAAVNQMAEAQSLMGPVMILLLAPYILAPFIGQAPNSALAVSVSFIPPVNAFAMLARMASDTPPPAWQAPLSVLVSLATALLSVWFAAKIFRIGLLMHGKPPDFATLIRWARMA